MISHVCIHDIMKISMISHHVIDILLKDMVENCSTSCLLHQFGLHVSVWHLRQVHVTYRKCQFDTHQNSLWSRGGRARARQKTILSFRQLPCFRPNRLFSDLSCVRFFWELSVKFRGKLLTHSVDNKTGVLFVNIDRDLYYVNNSGHVRTENSKKIQQHQKFC